MSEIELHFLGKSNITHIAVDVIDFMILCNAGIKNEKIIFEKLLAEVQLVTNEEENPSQ